MLQHTLLRNLFKFTAVIYYMFYCNNNFDGTLESYEVQFDLKERTLKVFWVC